LTAGEALGRQSGPGGETRKDKRTDPGYRANILIEERADGGTFSEYATELGKSCEKKRWVRVVEKAYSSRIIWHGRQLLDT